MFISLFLRSSQHCDVDSDCGNPKERCCSNIGTCHDKRGLDKSCNFVVSDTQCLKKILLRDFLGVNTSRAPQAPQKLRLKKE